MTIQEMTTEMLHQMFTTINKDDPEGFVDLADVEYYADQISNLYENDGFEIPFEDALKIAKKIAEMDK